jgi:hypothetical protein
MPWHKKIQMPVILTERYKNQEKETDTNDNKSAYLYFTVVHMVQQETQYQLFQNRNHGLSFANKI